MGQTALVTDAMRAVGLSEGRYVLGNEEGVGVTVQSGMAVSIATMDELVRNAVRRVGLPLSQALQMAWLTCARILGIIGRTGEIAVGKEADQIILDEDLGVVATIVARRVVYRRDATVGGGLPLAVSSG